MVVAVDVVGAVSLGMAAVTAWATAPASKWRARPFRLLIWAVLLYACFLQAIVKPTKNHFEVLGLPANAAAYRVALQSKELLNRLNQEQLEPHQMKAARDKIHLAADVLSSLMRRQNYERFGDFSQDGRFDHEKDLPQVVQSSAYLHCLYVALAFGSSVPRRLRSARPVLMMLCAASVWFEVVIRLSGHADMQLWPFNECVAFEKVAMLQRLLPLSFAVTTLIAGLTYKDQDATMVQLLQAVLASNRLIAVELSRLTGVAVAAPREGEGGTPATSTKRERSTVSSVVHCSWPLLVAVGIGLLFKMR